MNREFLMLAHTFDPAKHKIAGWYMSIKYQGQRCFWDGGATRGMPKVEVPWANNNLDERYVKPQISTGLWSRYGNVIHAPDWWLEKLPERQCLDGELWTDRADFQELRKIVSRIEPDGRWEHVKYLIFERPTYRVIFTDGKINHPQFTKIIKPEECYAFFKGYETRLLPFYEVEGLIDNIKLPSREDAARKMLYDYLAEEVSINGEGLMLRNPESFYIPKRSDNLLKVKPFKESIGTVIDWTKGKGKYEGMMGSLTVKWGDKVFNLSGFTDEERILPHKFKGKIEFKYVSLTDDGIPVEARYSRCQSTQ